MDDQFDTAQVFYPDYTVVSVASVARAVHQGGDYSNMVSKAGRTVENSGGSTDFKTHNAMDNLCLDWARTMNNKAERGVIIDLRPDIVRTEDFITAALDILRRLTFATKNNHHQQPPTQQTNTG